MNLGREILYNQRWYIYTGAAIDIVPQRLETRRCFPPWCAQSHCSLPQPFVPSKPNDGESFWLYRFWGKFLDEPFTPIPIEFCKPSQHNCSILHCYSISSFLGIKNGDWWMECTSLGREEGSSLLCELCWLFVNQSTLKYVKVWPLLEGSGFDLIYSEYYGAKGLEHTSYFVVL